MAFIIKQPQDIKPQKKRGGFIINNNKERKNYG